MDRQKIIQELISAQSALNMEPEPIPSSAGNFLSQTDYWVKHSYKNIDNAIKMLMEEKGSNSE